MVEDVPAESEEIEQPIILESAHRHDVSEEGMLHALRSAIYHVRQDDDMVMFVGPAASGTELVEVGVVIWGVASLPSHTLCGPLETSTDGDSDATLPCRPHRKCRPPGRRVREPRPQPDDLDAPLPSLMAVKLAAFRRAAAEKELAEAIDAAREAHLSWRELGWPSAPAAKLPASATPPDAVYWPSR